MGNRHVLISNLEPRYKKYFEKRVQSHIDNMIGHLNSWERWILTDQCQTRAWVLASRDLAKKMKRQYRNSHEI